MSMYDDLAQILIDKQSLSEGVAKLAHQLDGDYADKNPLLVCVLKGSSVFYVNLVTAMQIPVEMEFVSVSSYGAGTTSGQVKIKKDLDVDIAGRHVIVVEDIIDTGNTLSLLKKLLEERNPASVKICALLDKKARRVADIEGDYVCFDIPDEFVVGYGLDYAEKYRNLPEIGVLKSEVYSK